MTIDKQLPASRTAEIDSICQRCEVIPVLTINRIEDAVPLCRALYEGGLPVLEVTLRTDCALEALHRLRDALPEASIGAGTVLTPEQYRLAEDAGVDFVVTPGTTNRLFEYGINSPVPLLPGISTATELLNGWQYGYRRFKFFPAEASGGVPALKALAGPLRDVQFCPTGGITPDNAGNYLKLRNVMCVGGSWIMPKEMIENEDWDGIRKLALETSEFLKRH
ncbi:bifunctional 4-hydroxy-2-oxoglutarate aldolase/2-dehydro-3-deoxy-phosphogluconate aldolase [Larsenimonas rhizosphaerae]|uniref:2-dehydro-3-deoxy-phosphogluconate aldolase n=1 Tax=Larsenimonas rhizosphaerae TaxID=2944682 RepID=A0AA41ZGM5_9GAMM|nr:bifunctional 4-hydroxy-2-oxoglutarate aldolase/2-dehydro-3-deoxy-phosphogluconate aldolase [Larsenimonas rhizosphaerae]MCM2131746.1 bifunctional 4-hydroxy-2-oxoglutarate aldolase/2-dehydro-3-deoxy-phosphogluconate aldolase [Larsenimonas rhizosphaerae]MCX2524927.1 bifunctional 4-hydroxy-2-oxoglutarate aldolase/2-dehydro-3-deoxy-phosphogluconate aldolase [Larsenimonas rhizosphaerae]